MPNMRACAHGSPPSLEWRIGCCGFCRSARSFSPSNSLFFPSSASLPPSQGDDILKASCPQIWTVFSRPISKWGPRLRLLLLCSHVISTSFLVLKTWEMQTFQACWFIDVKIVLRPLFHDLPFLQEREE